MSYDKSDQLRFALSHHRVGKRLVPRTWAINPWTGAKENFPQPIVARSAWTPLIKVCIADHGLRMDSTGRIAQRSVTRVVHEKVLRDRQRGYLPPIPEGDEASDTVAVEPTVIVLGADEFSAGNMSMMYVCGCQRGPQLYPRHRPGKRDQLKHYCHFPH